MNKKNILLVSDVKGWGGWVRGQYIKKHLSDEFNIDLMDMDEFSIFEREVNKNVFTMEEFDYFKRGSTDKEVFDINDLNDFILKSKKNFDYDLIYFLFHTMLVKKNVKRIIKNKAKVITIVTGFPTIKPIFIFKNSHYNNFSQLSSGCQAIGANNLISLKDLKKNYRGKTFYAPRGVDPDVFYPLSRRPKPIHDKFMVAYVGKPVPEKGIDIIKEVCNQAGVGLITNTRNFTDALGPDDMRELYNKADVYIVASTIDGTPNPALEAAACGKPIISNHIGNMPEFIENGYNGYLLRKEHDRNINKYVYWLKHLNQNREKCFEMGMNARETVLKSWSWEKVTENERKIFKEVLGME